MLECHRSLLLLSHIASLIFLAWLLTVPLVVAGFVAFFFMTIKRTEREMDGRTLEKDAGPSTENGICKYKAFPVSLRA